MGVSVYYIAIPPNSSFYARLQHDKAFNIMVSSVFHQGAGLYSYFELGYQEINDNVEFWMERYPEAFGDELAADMIIADFRSELRRTRQAHPGIENRITSMEKSSLQIEECLRDELSRRQIPDVEALVQKLMFGDQTLAPSLMQSDALGLVSRELVREGAKILKPIQPEMIFSKNDYYLEHFQRWRDLYLLADKKKEGLLIGVCY